MLCKSVCKAMVAGMLRFIKMAILLCLGLLMAGCAKTSVQATDDLWKTWQATDELIQQDYPETPPVVLVHGWNGSEFTWPDVKKLAKFEQHMQRDIYFFTYRTGIVTGDFPPLEILEEQLGHYLSSFKQVDVIAHSMGGLIVRQYLSHHADSPIRRVVFLSTPHFGTDAAALLERLASVRAEGNLQADEIQPSSDFLWQLNMQEGQELADVETLNAYTTDDLVVNQVSAWLPWAANIEVEGGHHTLASNLMDYDFILSFLATGSYPALAKKPERRDVWLRIRNQAGEVLPLTSSMLRRMDANLRPHQHGVSVCCDRPSALYESSRQSLIVEDVEADDVLWFTRRNGRKPVSIKEAGQMDGYDMPVTLREITVDERPLR